MRTQYWPSGLVISSYARQSLTVKFGQIFTNFMHLHSSLSCVEISLPKSPSITAKNAPIVYLGFSSHSLLSCSAVAGSKQVLKICNIWPSPIPGKVDLRVVWYSLHWRRNSEKFTAEPWNFGRLASITIWWRRGLFPDEKLAKNIAAAAVSKFGPEIFYCAT